MDIPFNKIVNQNTFNVKTKKKQKHKPLWNTFFLHVMKYAVYVFMYVWVFFSILIFLNILAESSNHMNKKYLNRGTWTVVYD
jgi:hypothetical protein